MRRTLRIKAQGLLPFFYFSFSPRYARHRNPLRLTSMPALTRCSSSFLWKKKWT